MFGWLMVRLSYVAGGLSLLAACGVFGLGVRQWRRADPQLEAFLQAPSAMQRFTDGADERAREGVEQVSPLVVQAQVFAAYLARARLTQEHKGDVMPPLVSQPLRSELVLPVRPLAASASFKLRATSCYPNEPGRSMALIAEPGVVEGQERWVKEGTQIGHFVIHEIRRGVIVYRDVETQDLASLQEMAVERGMMLWRRPFTGRRGGSIFPGVSQGPQGRLMHSMKET